MQHYALFEKVSNEIKNNEINEGVWAKAFSKADGDIDKAKAIYIKLRVRQIQINNITSYWGGLGEKGEIKRRLSEVDREKMDLKIKLERMHSEIGRSLQKAENLRQQVSHERRKIEASKKRNYLIKAITKIQEFYTETKNINLLELEKIITEVQKTADKLTCEIAILESESKALNEKLR
ncbi:hypothetical protein [Billgrantia montanilacus]|uniref:hypothetical protein n=1 Tax=Billgrantia montanilacus TaxID=2282305 RepID=UPI0011C072EA|nr:hypothetical protein [Halomonas montanilacus]